MMYKTNDVQTRDVQTHDVQNQDVQPHVFTKHGVKNRMPKKMPQEKDLRHESS